MPKASLVFSLLPSAWGSAHSQTLQLTQCTQAYGVETPHQAPHSHSKGAHGNAAISTSISSDPVVFVN